MKRGTTTRRDGRAGSTPPTIESRVLFLSLPAGNGVAAERAFLQRRFLQNRAWSCSMVETASQYQLRTATFVGD